MMGRLLPRDSEPVAARPTAVRAASSAERLLQALGADPDFVEAVLGDLAEEFAIRAAWDGVGAARWWYAREALRSAPHLVRSAIGQGGPRARARLAAFAAASALTLTLALFAVLARDGPPALLVAGVGDVSNGIVINNVRPVQLPLRVLDAAGHSLETDGVRYQSEPGAPMTISTRGVVSCMRRGDATVRATLGDIATNFGVQCRPVREIQASTWISFVAGDPPRHLPFEAIGFDDRPVVRLRGVVRVTDSSVATLEGSSLRPRAVGETEIVVEVGDQSALIRVMVHEPVSAFTGLRPDQRFVAVPVRLARGDTVRLALPRGAFWLKYIPRRADEPPPSITVDGIEGCRRGDGLDVYRVPLDEYSAYCVVHTGGAGVTVAHGAWGAPVAEGSLALERVEHR